jgi:hypothetical protein
MRAIAKALASSPAQSAILPRRGQQEIRKWPRLASVVRFAKERDTPARHHATHLEFREYDSADCLEECVFLGGRNEVISIVKASR